MKIFNARSIDVEHECQLAFNFRTFREQVWKGKLKFLAVYKYNANSNCSVFEEQDGGKLQDLSDQLANMQITDLLSNNYVR